MLREQMLVQEIACLELLWLVMLIPALNESLRQLLCVLCQPCIDTFFHFFPFLLQVLWLGTFLNSFNPGSSNRHSLFNAAIHVLCKEICVRALLFVLSDRKSVV